MRNLLRSGPTPRGRAARMRGARWRPWLLALPVLLGGCLDAPKLEDRWTRIDLLGASVQPNQTLTAGGTAPIQVSTAITYRSILTGFAVAELRASSSMAPGRVTISPAADRLRMATDIDSVLRHSVPVGRATRAVTGWDHLIQHIDFTIGATAAAPADSGGAPVGLFLLCYLGSGERMERRDGTDSIVVTPYPSDRYQILPVGMSFTLPSAPTPR